MASTNLLLSLLVLVALAISESRPVQEKQTETASTKTKRSILTSGESDAFLPEGEDDFPMVPYPYLDELYDESEEDPEAATPSEDAAYAELLADLIDFEDEDANGANDGLDELLKEPEETKRGFFSALPMDPSSKRSQRGGPLVEAYEQGREDAYDDLVELARRLTAQSLRL